MITDIDGNFSMPAPENGPLVIPYAGMITQEAAVSLTGRVVLLSDTEVLDEVGIVRYGKQSKFNRSRIYYNIIR